MLDLDDALWLAVVRALTTNPVTLDSFLSSWSSCFSSICSNCLERLLCWRLATNCGTTLSLILVPAVVLRPLAGPWLPLLSAYWFLFVGTESYAYFSEVDVLTFSNGFWLDTC